MKRLGKLVLPVLVGLAVYYAVFGGEYSVFDLHRARTAVSVEADTVARLRREIDSLKAWADSLQLDSATLERLARERFGMIRGGELLYRFAEPSESAGAPRDPGGSSPR